MKKKNIYSHFNRSVLIFLIGVYGCTEIESRQSFTVYPKLDRFSAYWNQGKAELSRYELQQVRYGEIHQGDAVLIFVTEDFLKDKQVKYDYGKPDKDVQSVLKLNFTRKFYTGVYPYSMMTSTFSPIYAYQNHALKISSSSQEWCGHTYMQLNNRENKFQISLNSYFQSEGDHQFELGQAMLEDEVWTKIRINPDLLPSGDIEIIPGMQYTRLLHSDMRIESAFAEKQEFVDETLSSAPLIRYQINYLALPRTLSITYEKEFPYAILAWEESFKPLAINSDIEGLMVTRAKRTHSTVLDYWNKNSLADSTFRHRLGVL